MGDSDHPEHLPNLFTEMTDQMNLLQRVINTVSIEMSMVMFTWPRKSVYSEIKTLLPDCPPLDEIEKETSLVFTNTHPIFQYPRTMTPEMIEIGGIHCKPANPLPPVRITIFRFSIFKGMISFLGCCRSLKNLSVITNRDSSSLGLDQP